MNCSKFLFFPATVILVCAGLTIATCSKTADQSAQRRSTAKLLDAYIAGYTTGDFTNVHFAADVTFEGPLTNGKIVGKSALQKFLSNVRAKAVRVKQQIIDGQVACVLAEFETAEGIVVPFCEFFRIENNEITEVRPYFDPRPLIR